MTSYDFEYMSYILDLVGLYNIIKNSIKSLYKYNIYTGIKSNNYEFI